ncbi:MAG: ribosome small subunit-dependent GTPase A [Candidatus Krumholzibacteriota bacterium]|nr:ribosome small subunit-dependent GTPase A [Candidatus Krumholzibacteriota bacterium]
MELKDLGFDEWFQSQLDESENKDFHPARVTAVDRSRYIIRNENGELPAELAGRLSYHSEDDADLPCVGDWVFVTYYDSGTFAIIHGLFSRKTILTRKSAGKSIDHQLIASNIDTAFVVQAADSDFNLRRLERYLAMVGEGKIDSAILLSKTDLVSSDELQEMLGGISSAGIKARVIAFSNESRSGLDEIRSFLEAGKTYCLLGSSGVGKTSLLNHLTGREEFLTRKVREKDGKGRHATTRRQLIVLDNGAMLIDNPGMRELGLIGLDTGIDESFSDITQLTPNCRFRNCTYSNEEGCSVLEAVDNGSLDKERYKSYMKLIRESEFHQMSYVEKRKKDKDFGKYVKSVKKDMKKKGDRR